jgi:outer membrane protein assembly factor BamB
VVLTYSLSSETDWYLGMYSLSGSHIFTVALNDSILSGYTDMLVLQGELRCLDVRFGNVSVLSLPDGREFSPWSSHDGVAVLKGTSPYTTGPSEIAAINESTLEVLWSTTVMQNSGKNASAAFLPPVYDACGNLWCLVCYADGAPTDIRYCALEAFELATGTVVYNNTEASAWYLDDDTLLTISDDGWLYSAAFNRTEPPYSHNYVSSLQLTKSD